MRLSSHSERLLDAIRRAIAEHGAPNSFSFAELHLHHRGPPPMIAGRAARLFSAEWMRLAGVSFEGGRVKVAGKI